MRRCNNRSWLDFRLGDQANPEERNLDATPIQRSKFHKQLNAWKIRNSWSHSLARQESWHVPPYHCALLVNQVCLAGGWTLASFWPERSKGGCDHLFCSGWHCTSCTSCCKGKRSPGQVLGKNHKAGISCRHPPPFLLQHPCFLTSQSPRSAQWTLIAHAPGSRGLGSQPSVLQIFLFPNSLKLHCSFLVLLSASCQLEIRANE